MNNADEVARLQARVMELEARLEQEESAAHAEKQRQRSLWKSVTSGVLITLACLLAPLSVTSVWASTQISDTDAYVATMAPIADDPGVQSAVADEVTTAVMEELDVETLTSQALQVIAEQENMPAGIAALLPSLAVPLTNGIESFTRDQVEKVLASDQFADLWAEANRVAHEQVVTLLEGNEGGAVSAQDDTITLNLAPIIEEVKQRLVDRGFTLAANVPAVDRSFVLVESEGITKAQRGYRLLNALGLWLPFVVVGFLAAGVALARDRRRSLLRGALGITAALLLLGVVLLLVRTWYVETTPAGILSPETAGNVFDTLVRFLRTGLRASAVLGLVIAFAAFLAGPSVVATRTRATVQSSIGSARGGAETVGFQTGRFGSWVFAHRAALRVTTLFVVGTLLMFWDQRSAWTVVWAAVIVLLVLGLIEFLGRPPAAAPASEDALPAPQDTLPLPVEQALAGQPGAAPEEGTSSRG